VGAKKTDHAARAHIQIALHQVAALLFIRW